MIIHDYATTIYFTDGSQRYHYGCIESIIEWAARYDVIFANVSSTLKLVSKGENARFVIFEKN